MTELLTPDEDMPCDCCSEVTGQSKLVDNMFLCPMCVKRSLPDRFEMMLRFEKAKMSHHE